MTKVEIKKLAAAVRYAQREEAFYRQVALRNLTPSSTEILAKCEARTMEATKIASMLCGDDWREVAVSEREMRATAKFY